MIEVWKSVNGYEGIYEVSNKGRVRSLDRIIERSDGRKALFKSKILKPIRDNDDSRYVNLSKNNKKEKPYIHNLVAEQFLSKDDDVKGIVHIDGDRANNCAGNLKRGTLSRAMKYGIDRECIVCKQIFPNTEEHFGEIGETLRFRSECKKCDALKAKEYFENNRERRLKSMRKYSLTYSYEICPITRRTLARSYYMANRDKILADKKEYRKNNKDKIYALKHKRRSKMKDLEHNLTALEWRDIKESFGHACSYCGEKKKLSRDHFVPVSKGGEYASGNIIPSCLSCNSSKSDKSFFEWYPSYEHYCEKREIKILKHLNYKDNTQQLSIL